MASKSALLLVAAALSGCSYHRNAPVTDAGVASVNEPVVSRADYVFDASAPDGMLSPSEAGRLDGWFRTLDLRYGDSIFVDGAYSEGVRSQIQAIGGRYGLLVNPGAPVTGPVAPGTVRVVVSRAIAFVPNCPNWSTPAQPNYNNRMLPSFGCGVNSNYAAMVANPADLVQGRQGASAVDAVTGVKAIQMYRNWPLTAVIDGQSKRPLNEANTKKGE